MANPKLFVSFTGLLMALESGRVSAPDLADGLFVFACTRDHVYSPGANGEFVETIITRRPDLHKIVLMAVKAAKVDGRIVWRRPEDGNASYELVDLLLTGNGYKPLQSDGEDHLSVYCYPAVKERSRELEVIY